MFGDVYRGRRVLVTGDTGFKGSWLCRWLLELGAEVAGYAIDIPTRPSLFEALGLEKKIAHRPGDVRELAALKRAFDEFRPELVFHLAAQPLVGASYDDPKTTFDTNVGGTVNVLECLRASETVKAAVLVATDKCYENPGAGQAHVETDRLGGNDPYSASKACAELVFTAYQRSFKLPHLASARAGNVIGGGDWAAHRILPDCVRAWSQGQPVQIRNPASTRPWQHVLEPLGGYLWLGARLWQADAAVSGESFNFGPRGDSSQTVAQLLTELTRHWKTGSWAPDPAVTGSKKEAAILRLDCEKANARLKWRALLPFERSVELTVDWYRAFYEGKKAMETLTLTQLREYQELARTTGAAWSR